MHKSRFWLRQEIHAFRNSEKKQSTVIVINTSNNHHRTIIASTLLYNSAKTRNIFFAVICALFTSVGTEYINIAPGEWSSIFAFKRCDERAEVRVTI